VQANCPPSCLFTPVSLTMTLTHNSQGTCLLFGRTSKFSEWAGDGVRTEEEYKLSPICLLKLIRYLAPFRSQSPYTFCVGGTSSHLAMGQARESGVVPVEVLCNRHNLFAGTEPLSLIIYEPIAVPNFAWGNVPQFGGKGWS